VNSIRYIGLDVHRKTVQACIRAEDDTILLEKNFECTREGLRSFATEHLNPHDHIALEATFHSWSIVDEIAPFVDKVLVSNPMATKAIAQSKVKTDKIDARVLSELLRIGYLPEVWTPEPETRELRNLCARRASLVSDMVRLKNRIHGVLAKCLIPRPAEIFDEKGKRWIASLELPEWASDQLQSDLRLLTLAELELEAHDRILVKNAWSDPRVKLLITMPGVDVTVAMAVLAALGDITRFRDGHHLAAYFGLVPSTSQSGERCYHGSITKRGNGRARWLLIQAAQHLAAHPGPLGVFFRRIATRKNRNVAVVATARKLAVVAWHMLTEGEPYRYALPRTTQDKLARFRVKATGARKKTGPRKGSAPAAKEGTRKRTFPSLPDLYADEGLPPCSEIKPAERKALRQMRILDFVESTRHTTTVVRSLPAEKTSKEKEAPE
jgi:transposase